MAKPLMGTDEIARTARELIENEMILAPDLPAPLLAERIIESADPQFLEQLSRSLLVEHLAGLIQAERRKEMSVKRQQLLLPGYEHLPLRITGDRNKKVRLHEATYSDVRRYWKLLGRTHRDRRAHDPKMAEAKELMERMRKCSRKKRGIKVGELFAPEAP